MADYTGDNVPQHKRMAAGADGNLGKAAGKAVQNAMKKGGQVKKAAPMKKAGRGR